MASAVRVRSRSGLRQVLAPAVATALALSGTWTAGSASAAALPATEVATSAGAAVSPPAYRGLPMTVKELQRRLKDARMSPGKGATLDAKTRAAVKRFQTKFGLVVDGVPGPKTQKKLTAVTRNGNGILPACRRPAKAICVDKTLKLVWVLEKGKVLYSMDARFGRKGEQTREGAFSVGRKGTDYDRDGVVSLAEAKRYVSTTYESPMPLPLFFSGGQAIHYSSDFEAVGYASPGSHGCANTRDYEKMERLWEWARIYTSVYVYRGA